MLCPIPAILASSLRSSRRPGCEARGNRIDERTPAKIGGHLRYRAGEVFQDDGQVTQDSTREFLTTFMAEFRSYVGMVLTVLPRTRGTGTG